MEIWNASTLKSFTDAIRRGFDENAADFTLIQIHGSPAARSEDLALLERARSLKSPKVFLLHRPDEILLATELRAYFEDQANAKLVFLGDLIYRFPFWEARRAKSVVIPHPHLDFTLPLPNGRPTVGAFTSWGEMRDVGHYLSLVEELRDLGRFEFRIGGEGLEDIDLPAHVQVVEQPFFPHFNVQLYHLHGRKRYGESSGSLHRGVSVPVIFEANGAERIEGVRAVKVDADDELMKIDFAKAAREIAQITSCGLPEVLEENLKSTQRNKVADFARAVMHFATMSD